MTPARTCLIDSDALITVENLYYSFGICPGSWKSAAHHLRESRVFSIDRVRGELAMLRALNGGFDWSPARS